MSRNILETLLGAVVLIVAVGFLVFAYRSSQVQQNGGYELIARLDKVDGLEPVPLQILPQLGRPELVT